MATFSFNSMIRGYHVYREIWTATEGETLRCRRETGNGHDPFAVAVMKHDTIVGHIPRTISAVCSLFLRRHGSITCQVNGSRRFSSDLPQGGLEIPCLLIFSGACDLVTKVQKPIFDIIKNEKNKEEKSKEEDSGSPPQKRKKINDEHKQMDKDKSEHTWVRLDGISLKYSDKKAILEGHELHDLHIDICQKLLKYQYPGLKGLFSTLKPFHGHEAWVDCYIQLYHSRGNHWITLSTVGCKKGEINIYDSLYDNIDEVTGCEVESVFPGIKCVLQPVQKQRGIKDCGLFALAYATHLATGKDPKKLLHIKFDQEKLRFHLISCFEQKKIIEFPCIL